MPKCINNSNKSYKGTEPCPKGYGYHPECEKIGTIMKGRDGKLWIVKKVNKGNKDWVKL